MLEFQLFRIRVYPSQQRDLFDKDRTRPEMLREAIESLPSGEFRHGLIWHIGNITAIDESGLYFRLGRTSTSTLEIYDESEGGFVDQEFETAPYTHAIVDVELEVCAIAKKTRLSPATPGIARQFARLLNESPKATEFQALFEIDEVKDPEDFIAHLKGAYSISKFWVLFSRPNAFDAHEHFVKPFQRMVEASNGEKGRAELKGQNLNATTLETVARSAAATGDDAGAWMKPSRQARRVKKRLKGSSVNTSQEDVADEKQKRTLMDRVRALYRKVRGDGHAP
jgi:hypothetical protein